MTEETKTYDLVRNSGAFMTSRMLTENSQMVRYMQKQCENSGWQNRQECPDGSMLGVIIKLVDDQHSIYPPTLNAMASEAMKSTDGAVSFMMASDITSTLFRQMSPYQNEILTPQGIKIPIVDSLEDVIYLGTTNKLKGACCIVRKDRVVLLWSTAVENILPHGAEVEKLLLETVSLSGLQAVNDLGTKFLVDVGPDIQ